MKNTTTHPQQKKGNMNGANPTLAKDSETHPLSLLASQMGAEVLSPCTSGRVPSFSTSSMKKNLIRTLQEVLDMVDEDCFDDARTKICAVPTRNN